MGYLEREEVFESISSAATLGTLGLFAGAGFTKELLKDNREYIAYSWNELLEACCEEMKIDKEIIKSSGSYPVIASQMCREYANNQSVDIEKSTLTLKRTIAKLVTSFPSSETQKEFSRYLNKLNLNWVITTNYDTMIESLIPERAFPLSPQENFIKMKNLIPIYHIHGVKNIPESIVITNEDYVSLFRPNDYRQARLPFLIKESLVLMVGYGFGDINLISAVDWSKNVYTNQIEEYDFPIVQLLYTNNPSKKPYWDESGIIVFETDNIRSFFKDLVKHCDKYDARFQKESDRVALQMKYLNLEAKENINVFIDNESRRIELIQYIEKLSPEFRYIYPSYISFLRRVILQLEEESRPDCAFEPYNKQLIIILDILQNMRLKNMPTAFFQVIAVSFERLAHYIGDKRGQSWSAGDTWKNIKKALPDDMKNELLNYCGARKGRAVHLEKLLTQHDE